MFNESVTMHIAVDIYTAKVFGPPDSAHTIDKDKLMYTQNRGRGLVQGEFVYPN